MTNMSKALQPVVLTPRYCVEGPELKCPGAAEVAELVMSMIDQD